MMIYTVKRELLQNNEVVNYENIFDSLVDAKNFYDGTKDAISVKLYDHTGALLESKDSNTVVEAVVETVKIEETVAVQEAVDSVEVKIVEPVVEAPADNITVAIEPVVEVPVEVEVQKLAVEEYNITNKGTINVTLTPDVAMWEYSIDAGKTWQIGNGTSFALADGIYAIGDIKIRQSDIAGNITDAWSNSSVIEVDQTAGTVSASLNSDTGISNTDNITKDGVVNVTLTPDAASWQYSTDSGQTWQTGTGVKFTLKEGTYAVGSIKVIQTDNAGNTTDAWSNNSVIKIDQTPGAINASLNPTSTTSSTYSFYNYKV